MTAPTVVGIEAGGPQPPVSAPWERVEKFIGQVSHDLRNGLNACELQLTYLAEISTDPEAVAEVKQLRQSLAGMTKQLQALRASVSGAKTHPLAYPAVDLFEDLRERFSRVHADSVDRVRWQVDVAPNQEVLVDPEITLAAGLELLTNALCFAEKGAVVECRVQVEGGLVSFTVSGTVAEPPTIPLQDWGVAPLVSSRRGAYGLGLFRTHRALAAQGSSLSFTYLPEARVVTATVRLPLATPAPLLQP